MPRTCTICSHPARETIDSSLIRRMSYRNISDRFDVSETALSRHLNDHLADYVQQALSKYGEKKGVRILDKLTATLDRLDGFLDAAEANSDAREFVVVAGEVRKELELLAKLQGDLAQEGTINLNLSPEWIEIRTVIVRALEPHPDARRAILSALDGGGNGGA